MTIIKKTINTSFHSLLGLSNGAELAQKIPAGQMVMGNDISHHEGECFSSILSEAKKPVIICDANTYEAYGKRLAQSLCPVSSVILEEPLKADASTVARLRSLTSEADALLAVGSGTINDLCKYAAFLDGKPYGVAATALSMNGYASANASITVNGHKKTLGARPPRFILMDLGILAAAPKRLTQSGLGDSLCRSTAQADWLLSHLLLGTAYDDTPFRLLLPYEDRLLAAAGALMRAEPEALELLARTLIFSGLGMVMTGSSHPASQGEHMIAHTMEMKHGESLPATYHGEQIAVTTLTMAQRQEERLGARPTLRATEIPQQELIAYFGEEIGAEAIAASGRKALSAKDAKELNVMLEKNWEDIARRLQAVRRPPALLASALREAGMPASPEALGWPPEAYAQGVRYARFTRERFTFLDI